MEKGSKMLIPERIEHITEEIAAWNQEYLRNNNLRCGNPIEDELHNDSFSPEILGKFIKETGITLKELEMWNEQTLEDTENEMGIHPDHLK